MIGTGLDVVDPKLSTGDKGLDPAAVAEIDDLRSIAGVVGGQHLMAVVDHATLPIVADQEQGVAAFDLVEEGIELDFELARDGGIGVDREEEEGIIVVFLWKIGKEEFDAGEVDRPALTIGSDTQVVAEIGLDRWEALFETSDDFLIAAGQVEAERSIEVSDGGLDPAGQAGLTHVYVEV